MLWKLVWSGMQRRPNLSQLYRVVWEQLKWDATKHWDRCPGEPRLPGSRRQPEPVREPPLQYWDLDRANVLRDIQHLDEWILANCVIHGADEAVNPGPLPRCVFGDNTSHHSKFPSTEGVGTVLQSTLRLDSGIPVGVDEPEGSLPWREHIELDGPKPPGEFNLSDLGGCRIQHADRHNSTIFVIADWARVPWPRSESGNRRHPGWLHGTHWSHLPQSRRG